MENDNNATKIRVDRLEKDVSKLQENDEEKSKILSKMDKASGKAEVYQEQIMANLASITASVAKTLDKATETEVLAKNLKTVTDKQSVDIKDIKLYNGDCLKLMDSIEDKSIDMILCDLPYGTAACKWDSIITLKSKYS